MPLRHNFVSAKAASADNSVVDGPKWNADHTLVNELNYPPMASEPATPPSGVHVYARELLPGHTTLKVKRPSGIDSPLQDSIAFNRLVKFQGGNNVITPMGSIAMTTSGTLTSITPASGSSKSHLQRVQMASGATAGNLTSYFIPNAGASGFMRGGVAGEGGFRFLQRLALNQMQAGNRAFFGMSNLNAAFTNVDPLTSTTPQRVGIGFNTNSGNWQLIHNASGTAPTVIDLGANFPLDTTSVIELVLFARPHNGTDSGNISYRIRRYTTSSADPVAEATGTLTTNIPANGVLLYPWGGFTNNATAAVVSFHFGSVAVESDW